MVQSNLTPRYLIFRHYEIIKIKCNSSVFQCLKPNNIFTSFISRFKKYFLFMLLNNINLCTHQWYRHQRCKFVRFLAAPVTVYSNQSPIAQTRPQSCEAAVSRSTRDHLVRLRWLWIYTKVNQEPNFSYMHSGTPICPLVLPMEHFTIVFIAIVLLIKMIPVHQTEKSGSFLGYYKLKSVFCCQ